jgi:ribose/xylose/arabinose/galactoside ABC-type transport system permease subunit
MSSRAATVAGVQAALRVALRDPAAAAFYQLPAVARVLLG